MRRTVLEPLRWDIREMLLVTEDQNRDIIEIAHGLKRDGDDKESEGKIVAPFVESVFYNGG